MSASSAAPSDSGATSPHPTQPQSSPRPPSQCGGEQRRQGLPRVRSHALFLDGEDEDAGAEGIIVPKQICLEDGSPDLLYDTGSHALQGTSSRMEDRVLAVDLSGHPHFVAARRAVLVAVLDGHAGSDAVSYLEAHLAQHLLEEVARQIGVPPVFLPPRSPQATGAAPPQPAAAPGAHAASPATADGVAGTAEAAGTREPPACPLPVHHEVAEQSAAAVTGTGTGPGLPRATEEARKLGLHGLGLGGGGGDSDRGGAAADRDGNRAPAAAEPAEPRGQSDGAAACGDVRAQDADGLQGGGEESVRGGVQLADVETDACGRVCSGSGIGGCNGCANGHHAISAGPVANGHADTLDGSTAGVKAVTEPTVRLEATSAAATAAAGESAETAPSQEDTALGLRAVAAEAEAAVGAMEVGAAEAMVRIPVSGFERQEQKPPSSLAASEVLQEDKQEPPVASAVPGAPAGGPRTHPRGLTPPPQLRLDEQERETEGPGGDAPVTHGSAAGAHSHTSDWWDPWAAGGDDDEAGEALGRGGDKKYSNAYGNGDGVEDGHGDVDETDDGDDEEESAGSSDGGPPWEPPRRHSAAAEWRRSSRAVYDSGGGCQPPDPPVALRNALLRCERELMELDCQSGTTALVALMLGSSVWLANVGDCRAVVCDDGEARQLTVDHKAVSGRPGDLEDEAQLGAAVTERQRLLAAGVQLSSEGYLQVTAPDGSCSDIAVSRNLGCAHLKNRQTSGRGSSWQLRTQLLSHSGGTSGPGHRSRSRSSSQSRRNSRSGSRDGLLPLGGGFSSGGGVASDAVRDGGSWREGRPGGVFASVSESGAEAAWEGQPLGPGGALQGVCVPPWQVSGPSHHSHSQGSSQQPPVYPRHAHQQLLPLHHHHHHHRLPHPPQTHPTAGTAQGILLQRPQHHSHHNLHNHRQHPHLVTNGPHEQTQNLHEHQHHVHHQQHHGHHTQHDHLHHHHSQHHHQQHDHQASLLDRLPPQLLGDGGSQPRPKAPTRWPDLGPLGDPRLAAAQVGPFAAECPGGPSGTTIAEAVAAAAECRMEVTPPPPGLARIATSIGGAVSGAVTITAAAAAAAVIVAATCEGEGVPRDIGSVAEAAIAAGAGAEAGAMACATGSGAARAVAAVGSPGAGHCPRPRLPPSGLSPRPPRPPSSSSGGGMHGSPRPQPYTATLPPPPPSPPMGSRRLVAPAPGDVAAADNAPSAEGTCVELAPETDRAPAGATSGRSPPPRRLSSVSDGYDEHALSAVTPTYGSLAGLGLGLPPLPPSPTLQGHPHEGPSGGAAPSGTGRQPIPMTYHKRSIDSLSSGGGAGGCRVVGAGRVCRSREPSPASPFARGGGCAGLAGIAGARLSPLVEGGSSVEGAAGGTLTGGEDDAETGPLSESSCGGGYRSGGDRSVGRSAGACSDFSAEDGPAGGSAGGGGGMGGERRVRGSRRSRDGFEGVVATVRFAVDAVVVGEEAAGAVSEPLVATARVAEAAAAAAAIVPLAVAATDSGRAAGAAATEAEMNPMGLPYGVGLRSVSSCAPACASASGAAAGAVLRTCATFSAWTLRSAFVHSTSAELAMDPAMGAAAMAADGIIAAAAAAATASAAADAIAAGTVGRPEGTALGGRGVDGGGDAASFGLCPDSARLLGSDESTSASAAAAALIPDPDLFHYQISQDSEFLICACDGLWDVMRNGEACRMVRRWLADGRSATSAAEALCQTALKLGSTDNISAVVLRFSGRPLALAPSRSMLRRVVSEAVL